MYGIRTKQEMSNRYHVYTDEAGMAVSGSDIGSLFTNGGGVVDVGKMR